MEMLILCTGRIQNRLDKPLTCRHSVDTTPTSIILEEGQSSQLKWGSRACRSYMKLCGATICMLRSPKEWMHWKAKCICIQVSVVFRQSSCIGLSTTAAALKRSLVQLQSQGDACVKAAAEARRLSVVQEASVPSCHPAGCHRAAVLNPLGLAY